MTTPKLFCPDEALVFRTLPEEFRVITEMAQIFKELTDRGYAHKEALYHAFVQTHKNNHGISCTTGAMEFYNQMTEYLRTAMDMVEMVIDRYLRPFAERLPSHNAAANCLDPVHMLKMATTAPGPHASSLDRRLYFEARRQLAIALQLFLIESVDRESYVADDLTQIEQLSWERLFLKGRSQDLWVVAELDPNNSNRSKKLTFFTSKKPASRLRKSLQRRGILCKEEFLPSRIVLIGQRRFLVYVINRRKRLFSTLLKLERGRPTADRRGWKYVVVGVEGRKGIRTATREDAMEFLEYSRGVLWQNPLMLSDTTPPANPFRHPTYWDVKITGRFLRRDNGRFIAGPAEQIITTITDYIDSYTATDDLNHALYRAHQVFSVIGPLWFPYRKGPYRNMEDLKLPRYGVNWELGSVRHDLERWWRSQL